MKRKNNLLKVTAFLLAVAPLVVEGRKLFSIFSFFMGEPKLPAKFDVN